MTDLVKSYVPKLPLSFQSRGWAVPFTSPFLAQARLRLTPEGRLEYLLPGLAGSGETYVIPHSLLSDIGELTVYDRTLLELIAESPTLNPAALRNTVNTVSATGLAGTETAKRARATIAREMDNWLQIHAFLVRASVKHLGDGRVMPSSAEYAIKEGRRAVYEGLGVFSTDFGLAPKELFKILETWAGILSLYGTPRGSAKGPLLLLTEDMKVFNDEMTAWSRTAPLRFAQMSEALSRASKETINEVGRVADTLSRHVHNIGDTIALWKTRKTEISEAIDLIDSLLDGWPRILAHWEDAKKRDDLSQRLVIEKSALSIPILPQDFIRNRTSFWIELRATQAEWAYIIKPYVSSSTQKTLSKAFRGCRTERL